jgi:hypothetical protein
MTKRRFAQVVLLVGALGVFYFLSRAWPRDQVVRFDFGAAAPRVEELRFFFGDAEHGADFHYEPGKAPRIVESDLRLPDGDYTVDVDVGTHGAHATQTRKVHLSSGSTVTVDLSRQVPE